MTSLAPLALLAAAQSAASDGKALVPASSAAILAGGAACIGVTVDPAGEDARLRGWTDATDAQTRGMTTDGRVVARDNVVLTYKTGVDGGCVVQARTDAAFDKAAFYADLGKLAGVRITADPKQSRTDLPNGELMMAMVGGGFAQLIVANPKGKHARIQGN